MLKSGLNVALKGLDDIFSTEESRQEEQREQVQQIPVSERPRTYSVVVSGRWSSFLNPLRTSSDIRVNCCRVPPARTVYNRSVPVLSASSR